jgi:hypothetical protein
MQAKPNPNVTVSALAKVYDDSVAAKGFESLRGRVPKNKRGVAMSKGLSNGTIEKLAPYFYLLGTEFDSKVAITAKVSRGTIINTRRLLGIPTFVRALWTEKQHEHAVKYLRNRHTLRFVALTLNLKEAVIRRIATKINWHKSWVDTTAYIHSSEYVGRIKKLTAVSYYNNGMTLAAIGKKAGVTHQAVRQVLMKAGCKPRHKK